MGFFDLFRSKTKKSESVRPTHSLRDVVPDGSHSWVGPAQFVPQGIEVEVLVSTDHDEADALARAAIAFDQLGRRFEDLKPSILAQLRVEQDPPDDDWEIESIHIELHQNAEPIFELAIVGWIYNHWITMRVTDWATVTVIDVSG